MYSSYTVQKKRTIVQGHHCPTITITDFSLSNSMTFYFVNDFAVLIYCCSHCFYFIFVAVCVVCFCCCYCCYDCFTYINSWFPFVWYYCCCWQQWCFFFFFKLHGRAGYGSINECKIVSAIEPASVSLCKAPFPGSHVPGVTIFFKI